MMVCHDLCEAMYIASACMPFLMSRNELTLSAVPALSQVFYYIPAGWQYPPLSAAKLCHELVPKHSD